MKIAAAVSLQAQQAADHEQDATDQKAGTPTESDAPDADGETNSTDPEQPEVELSILFDDFLKVPEADILAALDAVKLHSMVRPVRGVFSHSLLLKRATVNPRLYIASALLLSSFTNRRARVLAALPITQGPFPRPLSSPLLSFTK